MTQLDGMIGSENGQLVRLGKPERLCLFPHISGTVQPKARCVRQVLLKLAKSNVLGRPIVSCKKRSVNSRWWNEKICQWICGFLLNRAKITKKQDVLNPALSTCFPEMTHRKLQRNDMMQEPSQSVWAEERDSLLCSRRARRARGFDSKTSYVYSQLPKSHPITTWV